MDSSAWTFVFTLAAHLALIGIDMSQITIHRNGLKLTALDTLAATYATVLAFLDSQSTFVLVVAENHHLAVLGTLGTEFNDTSGTCLLTGTTSCTFRLVYLSNTSDRVNLNGTKKTGMLTVTLAPSLVDLVLTLMLRPRLLPLFRRRTMPNSSSEIILVNDAISDWQK